MSVALQSPKVESVHEDGTPDGWAPAPGFLRDTGPNGQTQIVVSVPVDLLATIHKALVATLAEPVGVLYRQIVDRRAPRPAGSPPRDFVAIERRLSPILEAIDRFTDLIHHDARCEVWVRGAMGEQVVLDHEGLLYCAPDDPVFEDVLLSFGLNDQLGDTIRERNYPKHWFHASCDAQEDELIRQLELVEVAPPGRR